MKRKTRGSVTASIALFITSGVFASVLGLRQYDRATTTEGWVSSTLLQAGEIVTPQKLKRATVKTSEAGLSDPRQLVGKRMTVNKDAGQAFRPGDLAPPRSAKVKTLSQQVPEGRVLLTLPLGKNATLPVSQLNAGDRLDVLVRGRRGVRTAATDVRLIGVMRARTATAPAPGDEKITSLLPQRSGRKGANSGVTTLVLAVQPDHVYPLAHIGTSEPVSLVLHSAHDVAAGTAVSVTPPRKERSVELVIGLSRSTVFVQN